MKIGALIVTTGLPRISGVTALLPEVGTITAGQRMISTFLCAALLAVYLVGVHDGKVALWKDNNPAPIKVFPYNVSDLPQEAQRQLEAGVKVNSLRELRKLAEQYLP